MIDKNIASSYIKSVLRKNEDKNWANAFKSTKILFFAHAYSLIYYNEPLINDTFIAFLNGPSVNITDESSEPDIYDYDKLISKTDLSILDTVIDGFKDFSPENIVALTHTFELWKNKKIKGIETEEKSEYLIKNEEIKQELKELDFYSLMDIYEPACH